MKKLLIVIILMLSFSGYIEATVISIDFEDLSNGDAVYDQYAALGVTFSDSLALSPSSPGMIVSDELNSSNNVLMPTNYTTGIYVLFDNPIIEAYIDAYEFEPDDTSEGGTIIIIPTAIVRITLNTDNTVYMDSYSYDPISNEYNI